MSKVDGVSLVSIRALAPIREIVLLRLKTMLLYISLFSRLSQKSDCLLNQHNSLAVSDAQVWPFRYFVKVTSFPACDRG